MSHANSGKSGDRLSRLLDARETLQGNADELRAEIAKMEAKLQRIEAARESAGKNANAIIEDESRKSVSKLLQEHEGEKITGRHAHFSVTHSRENDDVLITISSDQLDHEVFGRLTPPVVFTFTVGNLSGLVGQEKLDAAFGIDTDEIFGSWVDRMENEDMYGQVEFVARNEKLCIDGLPYEATVSSPSAVQQLEELEAKD